MLTMKKTKLFVTNFSHGPYNKYDIVYLLSYYEKIMGNSHDLRNFEMKLERSYHIISHLSKFVSREKICVNWCWL